MDRFHRVGETSEMEKSKSGRIDKPYIQTLEKEHRMLKKTLRVRIFVPVILFLTVFRQSVNANSQNANENQRHVVHASTPDQPSLQAAPLGFGSSLLLPFSTAMRAVKLSKIRYNRVEGLFLGVSQPQVNVANFEPFGNLGYGFESSAWRYEIGLKRSWFWMNRLEVGAAYYDLTDTMDRWIVSGLENTLAAILFREDFMDYFHRKGWRFYATQNISETYFLGLEYRSDRYENMKNKTDWSLFGGDKTFRLNPPIEEGKMHSISATAEIDLMGYREGWIFKGEYEKGGDFLGGDIQFYRFLFQGKRYQKTIGNQRMVIRLMAGLNRSTASDTVPEQKRFDLGGIETLRGYRFKEFTGDRMLLGNLYYLFGGDLLSRSGIPILRTLQLILFADAGTAFFTFDDLQIRDLRTDIGIAVADIENTLRINLAKRLDRSDDSIKITVRLLRKF